MEPRTNRSDRRSHDRRRRGVVEPVERAQDDRLTIGGRKGRDRGPHALDDLAATECFEGILWRRHERMFRLGRLEPLAPPRTGDALQRLAAGNPEQIALETRTNGIEAIELAQQGQKHLLDDIVGHRGAAHVECVPVNRRAVPLEQLGEGGFVALAHPLEQAGVVHSLSITVRSHESSRDRVYDSGVKKTKSAATVYAYFARVPQPARAVLTKLRATIRSVVPRGSSEVISYSIPALRRDAVRVWYAGLATHVSLVPGSAVLEAVKEDLTAFKTSKGTVKFPLDKPLPTALIKRIW